MGFLKSVAISIARPIYRALIERPLWWFLSKVKAYFFSETAIQLEAIERRLAELERRTSVDPSGHRWTSLEEKLRGIEAADAAQWDAVEQLLLAMFRQSEVMRIETASVIPGVSNGFGPAEIERAHAAGHLR